MYHAALPWYEAWGGNPQHSVDDWMMPPEQYATELAGALEHGRNYFAENPGALLPLVFEVQLPGGGTMKTNFWIILPTGFAETGRRFPLIIGLHGSGWLGHKISFVRKPGKPASAGRAIEVTPIDEDGPWKIDFLNAYLDQLMKTLPVDEDRVYLEGHSLGAMATWEWALHNPERFAAISPRAGIGEPFRATRLKNVPAWVIHGANDEVVPRGYSDQMVVALQDCDARVRYSVLQGVEHNMPENLDEAQVVDWYLRQTRSHDPVLTDPLDGLGLNDAGFSPWETVARAAGSFWQSGPVDPSNLDAVRQAGQSFFKRAHDLGELVDAPTVQRRDLKANTASLWIATPRTLQRNPVADPTATILPSAQYVRFYGRGKTEKALAHVVKISAEVEAAGHRLSGTVWITPLTIWQESATYVAEYRVELK
jgi:pimeloyl-ACP methyl ester carboxylesterase